MLASSFLPSRFRGTQSGPPQAPPAKPSWLNKHLTRALQALAGLASSHPIQAIVVIALLASSSYIHLLGERLFDPFHSVRKAEWSALVAGSRTLKAGPDSDSRSWKWQAHDSDDVALDDDARRPRHLALITLVFPDLDIAPVADMVPAPSNLSVTALPSTSNSLAAAYSGDAALAFAVPYAEAPELLTAIQEIPTNIAAAPPETREISNGRQEHKMWIMKAARVQTKSSMIRWAHNAVTHFVDLLKSADHLDILIMALGYISMHLTFVSLFVSMKRMGSNFWLATSVLISSIFAFLLGLFVTTKLGVRVSMVLLSEGLPFLVVIVGFEKNICLTRAVLSHAIQHRRSDANHSAKGSSKEASATTESSAHSIIQSAIQGAIKDKGYDIICDYSIELAVLITGALSGVQGGLQQFCFLASWILFFDCIFLFTFYVAILCIKLEINRIRRHVEMRKQLEEDGVSRRVAENVARNNDWFGPGVDGQPTIFGQSLRSDSVPKFKAIMVTGFIMINVLNLCFIPFRSANSLADISSWARGLGGVGGPLPVDPFKVASNGLDAILASARSEHQDIVVTVLTPIKYELEFPSVHYNLVRTASADDNSSDDNLDGYGVGGRMVDSILKSLEDPFLSKWIVVALAMSVALNGYLFNAARWGIKDPNVPVLPIDPKELAKAQRFNETDSPAAALPGHNSTRGPPSTPFKPLTPVTTDDESEQQPQTPTPARVAAPLPSPLRLSSTPTTPSTRSTGELEKMLQEKRVHEMTDEEVIALSLRGKVPGYALEKQLKDCTRAVAVRRAIISRTKATAELTNLLDRSKLPYENYNWAQVLGACCENVIGYVPIPVGVAGPLVIDGKSYFLPMATTEGVLVASTSRGCKAINAGGGAVTVLTADGMTRGPCISFETLERAGAAKLWLDSDAGQSMTKKAFNSTSRFARLESMKSVLAGTNLYIRFKTTTGDAMGMNMISKGVEYALQVMATDGGFEDMVIVSVSGNFCTDKKPAAINWVDGRGKSIVAEAIIPGDIVRSVLKTDVDSMVELNVSKNLIGSAMAGSLGGFNAHAANIVAAIFIATGQDPAQVVESANCITIMKNLRGSLQISVSMPSLEVGTLGGGTILEPQSAMLDMLGVRGPHPTQPGENSRRLARIIGAAVLAGELSLCSALAAGHLVRAHMQHNRSAPPTRTTTPAPSSVSLAGMAGLTSVSSSASIANPADRIKRR